MSAPYTMTPKQLTVGGRAVVILRCSAVEALDLELSLVKVVGGGLAAAMGSADDAVAAVGTIAKQLTHAELLRLMNMLFKYVHVEGQQIIDINSTFSDRPRDIWEVFAAAVEHNLGPLGEWLREKFQSLKQTQGSKVSSP